MRISLNLNTRLLVADEKRFSGDVFLNNVKERQRCNYSSEMLFVLSLSTFHSSSQTCKCSNIDLVEKYLWYCVLFESVKTVEPEVLRSFLVGLKEFRECEYREIHVSNQSSEFPGVVLNSVTKLCRNQAWTDVTLGESSWLH